MANGDALTYSFFTNTCDVKKMLEVTGNIVILNSLTNINGEQRWYSALKLGRYL